MERRERRKVDDEWGNRRRRHRCECLRAVPPGTLVASVTGLKPAIDLLNMLATPLGCKAILVALAGPVRSLCVVPVQSVNPLRGEPPTGKPDAGDPPVRFGGRGDGQPLLPIPIQGGLRPQMSTLESPSPLGRGLGLSSARWPSPRVRSTPLNKKGVFFSLRSGTHSRAVSSGKCR